MILRRPSLALALASAVCAAGATTASAAPAILAAAKAKNPAQYRFTVAQKARISTTGDGRSFVVTWTPVTPPRGYIVLLHGFSSSAFDQFQKWQPAAKARGLGVISIQWRRGFDARAYTYSPGGILRFAVAALKRQRVRPGAAMLQGYSSGAIRVYAMGALDHRGARRFGLLFANAGAAIGAFPGRNLIRSGRSLSGTRWLLFCGGRDPHPDFTGCPAMTRSRSFLRARGGRVEPILRDPFGGHAGLFTNPANLNRAIATFVRVLDERGF